MGSEPFRLPAPKFGDETNRSLDSFTKLRNPHFSTPSGMLLPRDKQPPPMYGPRGSTVPPRFLNHRGRGRGHHGHPYQQHQQQQNRFRGPPPQRNYGSSGGFDRDVVPELLQINWAFWCEGCDFNCRSEEELARHRSEHRGCEVAGCNFVGHPGVMKRHWRLVHDEQRQQEKAQMDTKQTPEEIESWREQRRKRYPTKENVERRQHAQEERFKRGERIEEDKSRFPKRDQPEVREGGPGSFRNEGGHQKKRFKQRKKNFKKLDESEIDEDESRVGFKGTSGLKDYKEKVKTALSLLTGYGSDSGETSSEQEEEPSNVEPVTANDEPSLSEGEINDEEEKTLNPESLHISDDEQEPEDPAPEKAENDEEENPTTQQTEDQPATSDDKPGNRRNRSRKRRHQTKPEDTPADQKPNPPKVAKPLLDYTKLRRARQNTMLEKLLDKDIRHERNVLLQCVRFVVDAKFFGIGQPKEQPNNVEESNKNVV